jgi:hypothetical protein
MPSLKHPKRPLMPRDGSLTPADLMGKLDILRVECLKCDRHGQYRVDQLYVRLGPDAKLTYWLAEITKDCPRKIAAKHSDWCGARFPDLVRLFGLRLVDGIPLTPLGRASESAHVSVLVELPSRRQRRWRRPH